MGQLDPRKQTFVITDTESLSSAVDMKYLHLCGLDIPALGGTIEHVNLYSCDTETGTYLPVITKDGELLSIVVDPAVACRVQFEAGLLGGFRWLKFKTCDADDAAEAISLGADAELVPAIRDFR